MATKKEKNPLINPDFKGLTIVTPVFRVSYPHLDKPQAYKDTGKPKFQVSMLFDKKQNIDSLRKALLNAAEQSFGTDRAKWPLGPNGEKVAMPLRDGDAARLHTADKKGAYETYKGNYYLNSTNQNQPELLRADKSPLSTPTDIYAGCYCDAILNVTTQESGGKFFVVTYLQAVRFIRDGERIGGMGKVDTSLFPDVEAPKAETKSADESYFDDGDII